MVSDPKAICDPSLLEEHERIIEFVHEMVRSTHSSFDLLCFCTSHPGCG
jgi:hypothetical protein